MSDALSARAPRIGWGGMVVGLGRHPKSSTTLMFVWRPSSGHLPSGPGCPLRCALGSPTGD